MDILDRIKQLRDERGWSNYKLAREAQISEGSLNKWDITFLIGI